ncbi:MAG: anaerobic sulfatase maturase [Gammaproteobacteria bacterium]|jgi:uncharacterized protein|nr:anaerobic sulfatase maturase [Gammaproteobacteria bacterium]MBT7371720.1 anaerobic sulfatase maturase [Gammaproteobacteria bacterium]
MVKPGGPICNLDCGYCYYLNKTELYPGKKKFRMSEQLLGKFIRSYIASHPGPNVIFPWHGGEPTMLGLDFFRKAVALQQKYLPSGWKCINVPQTNGTLLDEEWCEFFIENNFAVGISIDGPAEFHDVHRPDNRGKPTHDRCMKALRMLLDFGVPTSVLCTVNGTNVKAPLEVYRFFREQGVTSIQFLPIVSPIGEGKVSTQSVSSSDYGHFLTAIFEEWLRLDIGKVSVQIIEECLAKQRGKAGSLCLYQEKCGDSIAMEHNGDLFACDHFVTSEWKLGNLNERSMRSMVESPKMKEFARAKKTSLPAFCLACDVKDMCNGGCPKDRIITTPDGEPGLNYLCEGLGQFFRHVRSRMEVVLSDSVESEPLEGVSDRPGRNAQCPCGSGRKYKKCCGDKDVLVS